jgi:hypothetical protein
MVNQGVVGILVPFLAGGFIHGGEVLQSQKPGRSFGLKKTEHFFDPRSIHLIRRHVGGFGFWRHRLPEFFLERLRQGLIGLGQFDASRRRSPHFF